MNYCHIYEKSNNQIQLYMVFDIYYSGQITPQPIHTYPFISRDPLDISRKTVLTEFFSKKDDFIYDKESIELDMKNYELGYLSDSTNKSKNKLGIFNASKKILTKEKENHNKARNKRRKYT